MAITIEKNIPVKRGTEGKYKEAGDAIRSMDVGDSFLFAAKTVPSPLYAVASAVGRRITATKLDGGQFRIWRTA
jgi:hypothetical protein